MHAAARFDAHVLAADVAFVVQVLGHAADVVAGHFTFASVAVKRAHPRVRHGRQLDQHNPVAADAGVRRAKADAQRFGAGDLAVEIFDEDIVVAAGMHFGKADFLPPRAHIVDVHQLGVAAVEPAFDDLRQCVGGVQRSEARDPQLHSVAVQLGVVADGRVFDRAGVDDIVQGAAFHQPADLVAFGDVAHRVHRDPQLRDGGGGAARGVQRQPQVVKPPCQRDDFLIIVFFDADQHGTVAAVRRRNGESGRR